MVDITPSEGGAAAVVGARAGTEAGIAAREKPALSFLTIWNMSFGFLGIQMAFSLQAANASRIFETLGANVETLALFWLAGPITGLLVQPVIGHFSDRTWGRWGRRKPYFLFGAIAASVALVFMPYSPVLWVAAAMLWILDAAINVSMEPFRAFVGDMLPSRQRTLGFSMQGVTIGIGAVIGSFLPAILTGLGVSNTGPGVPDTVKIAFAVGALILIIAVLYTNLTTKEYSPQELAAFEAAETSEAARARQAERPVPAPGFFGKTGAAMLGLGILMSVLIQIYGGDKQFFVFAVLVAATGVLFLLNVGFLKRGSRNFLSSLMNDLVTMPLVMKRLAVVQFFSWFALFFMWVYTTNAVTAYHYGAEVGTDLYNEGANRVGTLFAVYNAVSIPYALLLPLIARAVGIRTTHAISLIAGGVGFVSFYFITDPDMLWISMIGIGMAWAAVLTLPYAILSDTLPVTKMGTYMGIFNFFIVIPQLVMAAVMGPVIVQFLGGQTILGMIVAGLVMMLGAVALLFVPYRLEA